MTIKNILTMLVVSVALLLPSVARAQNRQLIQDEEQGQKRVALVIGNGDYTTARKLVNPANDAGDMAKTLRDVGFEVVSGTNLNLKQMTDKVREFGDKLKASGGVGLFYYAGHGVQLNNKNYLIPVEADITREDEIDFAALNFDQILRKMATANNGLNIVILDACRNNPFARSWSRGEDEGGLAQISAPTGTFIAYATSPDRTASDGTGRNGFYTAELLKYIKQPNLKIEETFKEVRKAVNKASGGKQIPWDSSSLSGDFYFSEKVGKNEENNPIAASEPVKINSLPSVDEVLNDYYKAVGGAKAKTIGTFAMKGVFEADYNNGQKFSGKAESYVKIPGKSLTVITFGNGNWIKKVSNGAKGWERNSAAAATNDTPQQISASERGEALSFADISAIKRLYPKITVKGKENIGGRERIVLEAVTADNAPEKIYFDAASKLIYRWDSSNTVITDGREDSFTIESYLENFVNLGGVQIPLVTRQKFSTGLEIIVKYDSAESKFGLPLDDKLFNKP